MRFQERVHIIPIGDDDVDRIVIPAEVGKADRIYLITKEGKNLYANVFMDAKNEILTKNIVKKDDLIELECDIYDFTEIVQLFAKIIREEKDELKNKVFISLSTGGNLFSAAGMLSCMIFNAEPYFLIKDFKKGRIPKNPEILPFPRYNIIHPDKEIITFLLKIRKEMKKKKKNAISKKNCLPFMVLRSTERLSGTSGDYNRLKFRYLDELEKRNYVSIEEKPRGKIAITPDGDFALKIFTIYYGLSEV